jgi:hypothetical protein
MPADGGDTGAILLARRRRAITEGWQGEVEGLGR